MELLTAVQLLGVLVGVLTWWVFSLNRRITRLEQKTGLRAPERTLD